MIRRDCLLPLLTHLNPEVNLEFNAHFLDQALDNHWWPVLLALIFYHIAVAIVAYRATKTILENRQFTFNSASRF